MEVIVGTRISVPLRRVDEGEVEEELEWEEWTMRDLELNVYMPMSSHPKDKGSERSGLASSSKPEARLCGRQHHYKEIRYRKNCSPPC